MNTTDLARLLNDSPQFSVLAGAGLSAPPPTCLPGWWAVNDAVLGALGDAVERLTNHSGLSSSFGNAIRQRRDTTPFLKPDLQAQLIEDEIAEHYFRALSAVDSEEFNAAHRLLAQFARQGRLTCVMTTNFDITVERAFDAAAVQYRRFGSSDDFEHLDKSSSQLPVVKIHGSADRPETIVDTLRQRLGRRPATLERWMRDRFLQSPTICLGFSAEDLQYDPDYLGIRPAARDGARFCFLVRNGQQPSIPLRKLAADFPGNVAISAGELPEWLFELAREMGVGHAVDSPAFTAEDIDRRRARASARLQSSLQAWAESLGPMGALNAVTSLLAASGNRSDSHRLLRDAWRRYRAPDDCSGPAYARYLHNYGETLLRAGALRNWHDRTQDFDAWKSAADLDPSQFFFRAIDQGGGPDSKARSLLCQYLAGYFVSTLREPLADLLRSFDACDVRPLPRAWIDACFSLSELLELLGLGQAATPYLKEAHRSAEASGDEMRRAEAAWRLARNIAFAVADDQSVTPRVMELATECCEIAVRLDIREASAGAALARAIVAIATRDFDAGASYAAEAERIFRSLEDLPSEMSAKRERARAFLGQASQSGRIDGKGWDELSESLQNFVIENAPGLYSLVKYELAQLAAYFDGGLALQLATDAAENARLQEHPLLETWAAQLRDQLAKGQAQA